MSNNAVAIAVILPSIVMLGLLLIVIAWKILDTSRERARAEISTQSPAFTEMRRVVGADLAELRRRLNALEGLPPSDTDRRGSQEPSAT